MNLADLLKKNFVLVPVVASVLVGTFTGVRYIVNLTDTINSNQQEIVDLKRDLKVAEKKMSLNICMDCNFEKKRCQCTPVIKMEDNMLKKIWQKIKSWFWIKD